MGVSLTALGDTVFVDGTGTAKSPYSCQPVIYSNKSLSIMGYKSEVHIKCGESNKIIFNGTNERYPTMMRLLGLSFIATSLVFRDCSAEIFRCSFSNSKQTVLHLSFHGHTHGSRFAGLLLTNSHFSNNGACVVVEINSDASDLEVTLNITGTNFVGNPGYRQNLVSMIANNASNQSNHKVDVVIINSILSNNLFQTSGKECIFFVNMNQNDLNLTIQDVMVNGQTRAPVSFAMISALRTWVSVSSTTLYGNNPLAAGFILNAPTCFLSIFSSQFIRNTFYGNRDPRLSSLIVIQDAASTQLEIRNSIILQNDFRGSGYLFNSISASTITLYLVNTTFDFNWAHYSVGGPMSIWNAVSATVIVKECTFSESLGEKGGIISLEKNKKINISVRNSTFNHNAGNDGGGSIFIDGDNIVVDISTTTFANNLARIGNGGAILVSVNNQSTIRISNSRIVTSVSSVFGGAISIKGEGCKDITIIQSRFDSNTGLKVGGALSVFGGTIQLLIQQSEFINNRALTGGAIALSLQNNSSVTVVDTVFENNSLFADGYLSNGIKSGGAININAADDPPLRSDCTTSALLSPDDRFPHSTYKKTFYRKRCYYNKVSVIGSTFNCNRAFAGGAISIANGLNTIQNCTFINNVASFQGGTIFASGESTSLAIVSSTLVLDKPLPVSKGSIPLKGSFIHSQTSGPLLLQNTSMDWRAFGDVDPLLRIDNGGHVDFADSVKTLCPAGSRLQFQNFSHTFIIKGSKYKETIYLISCQSCGTNSYSLQRGQSDGIGANNIDKKFKCHDCPYGADCSSKNYDIVARPNFWGYRLHKHQTLLKFIPCPLGYCEVPMSASSTVVYNGCQGNRGGIICGKCNKNYTESLFSNQCRQRYRCNDYWFWPVAFLILAVFAIYLVRKPSLFPYIFKNVFCCSNNSSGFSNLSLRLPAQENENHDPGYLKIVFYYYQVANMLLISTSTGIVLSTYFARPIMDLFNFQQSFGDEGKVCPLIGLTAVTKQLLKASEVFATLFFVLVFYAIHVVYNYSKGHQIPNICPYLGAVMEALLLGYSTLTSVSFKLLSCVSLGVHGNVLFIDGNISCYQWWQYLLGTFIIVFAVPFTVLLAWGSVKLFSGTVTIRGLVLGCIFPLPVLLYWLFSFLCYSAVQYNEHDEALAVKRALYGPFREPKDGKKGTVYWESILIARRLVLIVLHTFVIDMHARFLIMSFVCMIILCIHLIVQPFRRNSANILESCSLLSLVVIATINTYKASFISVGVEPSGPTSEVVGYLSQWIEVVLLGIVPLGFLVLVFLFVLSQIVHALYYCCNLVYGCISCCTKSNEELRLLTASATSSNG